MPELNYPPRRTLTLGAALAQLNNEIDALDDEIDEYETDLADTDESDADAETVNDLQEARSRRGDLRPQRDAVRWLAHGDDRDGEDSFDGYGEDAEVVVEAYTAGDRSRVITMLNQTKMGSFGAATVEDWMIAAGVVDAPWLDGGEDLQTRATIVEDQLPPGVRDWLGNQLEDIGDLSAPTEGN